MKKEFLGLFVGTAVFILVVLTAVLMLSAKKPVDRSLTNKVLPEVSPRQQIKTEVAPKVLFSIEPRVKAVRKNEALAVSISLQSDETVLAVDLDIAYNPQVLTLEKIQPGSFFNSPIEFSKNINESDGKIFYALGSLTPVSGKGTVANLTFTAKTDSSGVQVDLVADKTLVSVGEGIKAQVVLPSQ